MSSRGLAARTLRLFLVAGILTGLAVSAGCGQHGQALRTRGVCLLGGFSDEAPPVCLWIEGRCEPSPQPPSADREALRARLRVVNTGEELVTVTPASASLTTERGEKVVGAQAWQGGRRVDRVTVAPGAAETFDLVADVPPTPQPDSSRRLRFNLPYSYGNAHFTLAAIFDRADVLLPL